MFDFIKDEEVRNQAIAAHEKAVAELTDNHTVALDEAVNGLKSKNTELLDEKKQLQTKLKTFEDFDMTAAQEAMDFLENNKDAQLIKDGKVDELIQKKTSQMQSDHEARVSELESNLAEAKSHGTTYETLYRGKMVDDSLREAAVAAKVRPEAVTDVLLHGRNIFSLADDGSIESRDAEGKLRKTADDKVLTPTNWIEGLKKTSPHYWPDSVGAGARGGGRGDGDDLGDLIAKAAKSGDHAEYRRLREKQRGGK